MGRNRKPNEIFGGVRKAVRNDETLKRKLIVRVLITAE